MPRAPHGDWKQRIDERALRRGHRDRHGEAVAVRDVGDHHRAQRRIARRLGEREGRIDAALDLVRGAGEVDRDVLARDRYRRLHHDELGILTETFDVIGELVDPVRKLGDFRPGEPLRIVLEVRPVVEHGIDAVPFEQLQHLALAAPARGELCLKVAHDLLGGAHVEGDHVPQRMVGLAAGHELHDRQPQPFLEYFLGAERVAAGDDPAHVGVVRHRGRPCDQPGLRSSAFARENRGRDVDVGQVLAVGGVGVVEDEHVAGVDAPVVLGDELSHRVVEAAHVHGGANPLREGEPVGVEEGGGEVERVAHDPRVRGAHQGERHVVGNGVETALDQLELERVDVAVRGVHVGSGSMRIGQFMRPALRGPGRADACPGSIRRTTGGSPGARHPARAWPLHAGRNAVPIGRSP